MSSAGGLGQGLGPGAGLTRGWAWTRAEPPSRLIDLFRTLPTRDNQPLFSLPHLISSLPPRPLSPQQFYFRPRSRQAHLSSPLPLFLSPRQTDPSPRKDPQCPSKCGTATSTCFKSTSATLALRLIDFANPGQAHRSWTLQNRQMCSTSPLPHRPTEPLSHCSKRTHCLALVPFQDRLILTSRHRLLDVLTLVSSFTDNPILRQLVPSPHGRVRECSPTPSKADFSIVTGNRWADTPIFQYLQGSRTLPYWADTQLQQLQEPAGRLHGCYGNIHTLPGDRQGESSCSSTSRCPTLEHSGIQLAGGES